MGSILPILVYTVYLSHELHMIELNNKCVGDHVIRNKLSILMGEHKVKNFVLLEKETGITRKTLAKLYNDEGKGIDYATLDALCTFFGCQPGDILEHVPDED